MPKRRPCRATGHRGEMSEQQDKEQAAVGYWRNISCSAVPLKHTKLGTRKEDEATESSIASDPRNAFFTRFFACRQVSVHPKIQEYRKQMDLPMIREARRRTEWSSEREGRL